MDKSILTDILDLQGFFIEKVKIIDSKVYLTLEREGYPKCPNCGRAHKGAIKDRSTQRIQDLPLSGKMVFLEYTKERFICECGYRGYEQIEWLSRYSRSSNRFNDWLYIFCKVMSIKDVATLMGISKNSLYQIDKNGIKKELASQKKFKTKDIGFDEVSVKHGHAYATVISDRSNKKILDVLEGRKKDVITGFFESNGKRWCNQIRTAAMDMWKAFKTATEENCKNALICFDHFHIAQHFSRAIDKIRISEVKRLGKKGSEFLSGSRWLLLKNPSNLRSEEKRDLNLILKSNKRLMSVYIMRDSFREIYKGKTPLSRIQRFRNWIRKAKLARIKGLSEFLEKIIRWQPYIENSLRLNVSNSYSEGLNNKIRLIQRRAYGYKDFEYLRLKIFQQFNFPQVRCIYQ